MTGLVEEALRARASRDAHEVALLVDGHALTFASWQSRAHNVATHLVERGLRPGDRVLLWCDPDAWLDYAVALFGVYAAGGVAVPVPSTRPPRVVQEILADAAPTLTLSSTHVPAPAASLPIAPLTEHPADAPVPAVPLTAPAQILYTSGTTGARKGVLATHANLAAGLPPLRPPYLGHSRRAIHAFPLGTNAAQTALLNTLVARPTLVITPEFDADAFCSLIEHHRIGSAFLVPAMAADLVRTGALARHDVSSLVLVSSTAAPLPRDVAADLLARLPRITLVDTYTTTEASPAQAVMVVDPSSRGTLGRPADPAAISIRGDAGRPVPAGSAGAVWLGTPGETRR